MYFRIRVRVSQCKTAG